MEIKATRYTVPERIARTRAAKARKARIDGLSIMARRRGCTAGNGGDCPYCTGALTFERVPAKRDHVHEQLPTALLPEPEAWTYYDTAACFYGKWDYEKARNDRDFSVVNTWQAFEADHDAYFWSCFAEGSGIRWEPVNGLAWTHDEAVYEREFWDEYDMHYKFGL